MNFIWSEKINLIQILLGLKNHPNTNMNFKKITRIRIRILFGLKKSPEYEYEYYSVWKYRPNTNTNILVFEYYSNNIRITNYSLTSACSMHRIYLQDSKTFFKSDYSGIVFAWWHMCPISWLPNLEETTSLLFRNQLLSNITFAIDQNDEELNPIKVKLPVTLLMQPK